MMQPMVTQREAATAQPWRADEWRHVGRQVRDNWLAIIRLGIDAYPARIDWPPRVSRDKAFHRSHPERAVARLFDAERRFDVSDRDVRRARAELQSVDIYHREAFEAIRLRYPETRPLEGLEIAQIAARLLCSERRVYELLDAAWAFVAWSLYGRP